MKVLIIEGKPCFYRPENEAEQIEMIKSLWRSVRERKLKIPVQFRGIIESFEKLQDKTIQEALSIVRADPNLQAFASGMYAQEHPTYDPSKVKEVDAEKELDRESLARIKEQIRKYNPKPLEKL